VDFTLIQTLAEFKARIEALEKEIRELKKAPQVMNTLSREKRRG
jgi:hypothetical protein